MPSESGFKRCPQELLKCHDCSVTLSFLYLADVLKEFAPQVQGAPELEKAKELFEREAGALHKLHHPQLPGFWELFQADMGGGRGCLFLVQDYVEGQTYFDVLKSGQRLSEAEVTQL